MFVQVFYDIPCDFQWFEFKLEFQCLTGIGRVSVDDVVKWEGSDFDQPIKIGQKVGFGVIFGGKLYFLGEHREDWDEIRALLYNFGRRFPLPEFIRRHMERYATWEVKFKGLTTKVISDKKDDAQEVVMMGTERPGRRHRATWTETLFMDEVSHAPYVPRNGKSDDFS